MLNPTKFYTYYHMLQCLISQLKDWWSAQISLKTTPRHSFNEFCIGNKTNFCFAPKTSIHVDMYTYFSIKGDPVHHFSCHGKKKATGHIKVFQGDIQLSFCWSILRLTLKPYILTLKSCHLNHDSIAPLCHCNKVILLLASIL